MERIHEQISRNKRTQAGDCLRCVMHNGVVPLKDILAVVHPHLVLGRVISRLDSTAVTIKSMIPLLFKWLVLNH